MIQEWKKAAEVAANGFPCKASYSLVDSEDVYQECLIAAWRNAPRARTFGELVVIARRRGATELFRKVLGRDGTRRKRDTETRRLAHGKVMKDRRTFLFVQRDGAGYQTVDDGDAFEYLLSFVTKGLRREVVRQVFGLGRLKREVSESVGVSPARVSQLVAESLEQIRIGCRRKGVA